MTQLWLTVVKVKHEPVIIKYKKPSKLHSH